MLLMFFACNDACCDRYSGLANVYTQKIADCHAQAEDSATYRLRLQRAAGLIRLNGAIRG
jgi:hypothetical protein